MLKTFEQIYAGVSPAKREFLLNFRRDHPYQTFTFNGVEWRYIASGTGEQAVLILPGGMGTGEASFSSITRLEPHFRVLSPSYPLLHDGAAVLDGLAAVLDHAGVDTAHVLGHSLGAGLGHLFIRRHPERVQKMAIDGFGLYTPAHVTAVKIFIAVMGVLPNAWGLRAYYGNAMRRLLQNLSDPEERTFLLAYTEEMFETKITKAVMMNMLRLLLDFSQRTEEYHMFEPVERPERVLLLLAQDDRGFSQTERDRLIATYPGARIHEFTAGGHLAGLTNRKEFNQVVDEFLIE